MAETGGDRSTRNMLKKYIYKNHDNINSNLILNTTINRSNNYAIEDSGCTINCLSEKYLYNIKRYNEKGLLATQPNQTIIKSNYKCGIKVSTLIDR